MQERYTAKPVNWGVKDRSAEGKTPMVLVEFLFKDATGADRRLTWYGHLSTEKTKKITIKALIAMGLKGDLPDLAKGPEAEALDASKEVSITLIDQKNEKTGKTFKKVQWVNPIRTSVFDTLVATNVPSLAGDIMAMRTEIGVPEPTEAPKEQDNLGF